MCSLSSAAAGCRCGGTRGSPLPGAPPSVGRRRACPCCRFSGRFATGKAFSARALLGGGGRVATAPGARLPTTIPAAYRAARGPRGPDGVPPRAVARPPVAGRTRCCGPSSRRGPLLAAQSWGASSPTFLSEHPGVRAGSSCAARRRLSRFPPDGGA